MPEPAPLIVTLVLDTASQDHFDALRQAHFPPDRLFVGAHVTLFHALPGDLQPEPAAELALEAARSELITVRGEGIRLLGRGVAFALHSGTLLRLRDRLRQRWAARLTAQDQQSWRPHVTIQNKVEPARARVLHAGLSASFVPFDVTATGLGLWIYRHGPWEAVDTFPFTAEPCAL